MKKGFLFIGLAAMGISSLLTGCGTTEVDKAEYFAQLNSFVGEAETHKNHTPQRTEDLANVLLNSSKIIYIKTGVAMRDEVELRFGDAETLRVSQSLYNSAYSKKWEALRNVGSDDASKKKAATAAQDLKKAVEQIVAKQSGVKKTPDQLFTFIVQKSAFNDYVAYKHELKQNADKKSEVEKKYAKQKIWLAEGEKIGKSGVLTKEERAKAAARQKEIEKGEAALDKDIHRVNNSIKYWGAFLSKIAAPIAYSEAVKAANGNPWAIKGAALTRDAAIKAADIIMEEVLKEQPEEANRFKLPLHNPPQCVAILKDKLEQYNYAVNIANARNEYVVKALKWLRESNEALNDAAGE